MGLDFIDSRLAHYLLPFTYETVFASQVNSKTNCHTLLEILISRKKVGR
jgi:hypothetical protein